MEKAPSFLENFLQMTLGYTAAPTKKIPDKFYPSSRGDLFGQFLSGISTSSPTGYDGEFMPMFVDTQSLVKMFHRISLQIIRIQFYGRVIPACVKIAHAIRQTSKKVNSLMIFLYRIIP
jgi:hypothetical protein